MQMRNTVLVASCLCLLGFAAFYMTTGDADKDRVLSSYKTTTDGSYYRKYVKVSDIVSVDNDSSSEETKQYVKKVDTPKDLDVKKWEAYFQASTMSDQRRAIVLEALDTVNRKCIYHQLRAGSGTPDSCIVPTACDHEKSGIYNYKSQADYQLEDPVYLDCSYFIKHCYYAAGLEMMSSTSTGMYEEGEFASVNKESLIPGDIAVKRGHVKMYLGVDGSGNMTWVEMKGPKEDGAITVGTPGSGYKFKRFGALANDVEFRGGES